MLGRTTLLLTVLLSTSATAADQKILVPIFYNGAGIGSQWYSRLLATNNMSQSLRTPGVRWRLECAIWPDCVSDELPPNFSADPIIGNAPAGFILFVPEAEADKLILRLSIAAAPRYPIVGGTDTAVVRERDFRISKIIFPFIPISEFANPIRIRLRIYDPDATPGAQVRVSVELGGDPVPEPQVVTLAVPA